MEVNNNYIINNSSNNSDIDSSSTTSVFTDVSNNEAETASRLSGSKKQGYNYFAPNVTLSSIRWLKTDANCDANNIVRRGGVFTLL